MLCSNVLLTLADDALFFVTAPDVPYEGRLFKCSPLQVMLCFL